MTEACGTMCCTLAQANNPLFSILEPLHPHPSSGLHSFVLQMPILVPPLMWGTNLILIG